MRAFSRWASTFVLSSLVLTVPAFSASASAVESEETGTATLEWEISELQQVAAANGTCALFSAGVADGTTEDWRAVDGDVTVLKRSESGAALEVTAENACATVDGTHTGLRAFFSNGVVVEGEDVTTISWSGAVTVYSYGGIVPWYIQDPVLTIDGDTRSAGLTATVGGKAARMDDPSQSHDLEPTSGVTVLELDDVSLIDGAVTGTPRYVGVDYFPLVEADDPDSGREAVSAISDSVKAANPEWGSWPTSFVDFHYRTGLSTYWHTSGGGADSTKAPSAPGISLSGSLPEYAASLSISSQPVGVTAIAGRSASFEVTAVGVGELSYRWERASLTNPAVWTTIEGATSASLVMENLTAADHLTFIRAVVSDGMTSVTSQQALLMVEAGVAPASLSSTTDAWVFEGRSFTVTYSFLGAPAPSLAVETSRDGGVTWLPLDIALADSRFALVPFDDVSVDLDGMQYRVTATNEFGSATSPAVTLHVLPTPDVPALLWDPSVHVDGAPALVAGLTSPVTLLGGGYPQTDAPQLAVVPAGVWNARGDSYAGEGALTTRSSNGNNGGTFHTSFNLDLTAAAPDTAYFLVSYSPDPVDRSMDAAVPLILEGQSVPTSALSASAEILEAGGSVTLTASVTGSPAPAVGWQQSADGETWATIEDETGETLEVTELSQSTWYRVVADNGLGTAASAPVLIAVPVPAGPDAGATPGAGDTPAAGAPDTDAPGLVGPVSASPGDGSRLAATGGEVAGLVTSVVLLAAGLLMLVATRLRRRAVKASAAARS
ncbi:hypothetical protein [Microbacterium sp. 18062]|uniref:hypothetical protein n=1 Tax=Microbacterium sp. 18062 TaxID=2681410 RepID=UPI001358A7D4|nr:hypothetical protein [Microbacterium sp. 18062]